MAEEIKGITIDTETKTIMDAFGINIEELNNKFKKFMTNELTKGLLNSESVDVLEIKPINVAKSYLENFTLQEIGAMAVTGMFEKFDNFIKMSLETIMSGEESEDELNYDIKI